MKKVNWILGTIILLLIATSCKDDSVSNMPTETKLKGTSWKLLGFFDVEKNTLIEAEPKNCEDCYTLYFDTDSTASGKSILNDIVLNINTLRVGMTYIYETDGDGDLYTDILGEQIESYSYEKDKLKFYYNNKKNYLLYRALK